MSLSNGSQRSPRRLQVPRLRPLALLPALSLVAFIVALLSPMSAVATFPTAEEPQAEEEPQAFRQSEVQSYQQDFGVSAETAERNLAIQRRGAGIVELLKSTQGSRYAGVWFDNESGEFVIPLLSSDSPDSYSSDSIRKILGAVALDSNFRTEPARYSWEELEAAQKQLGQSVKHLSREGLVKTSIDTRTNAVVIHETEGVEETDRKDLDTLAKSSSNVEVRQTDLPRFNTETRSCNTFKPRVCSKPLRGGVAMSQVTRLKNGFNFSNIGFCTAGFKAIGNIFGNRFILTAGHCVAIGGSDWGSETPSGTSAEIGIAEEYTFGPTGEWAKINANGSEWDTGSWPSEVSHYWENQDYPISYEAWSYLGEYVCASGNKSGTSCGNVTALHVEGLLDATTGTYLPPENEAPGICNEEGDSGGPVFLFGANTALGLISAGEGSTCATNVLYYPDITAATTNLGVTVGTRIGGPPTAVTEAASSIQAHQATANGTINPNAVETSYHFEYGPTTAYGSSVPVPDGTVGHGGSNVPVSATIPGLAVVTTYHYRLVATSVAGTTYGLDSQFTTTAAPPIVTTEAASSVKGFSATLHATVNPQGAGTFYQFEYGHTSSYGTTVPVSAEYVGSGTSGIAVSQPISGLEAHTSYHFRVVAGNGVGVTNGNDAVFITPNKPLATTEPPAYINTLEPQLNGIVNPQGADTHYQFEYGLTTSYGSKMPVAAEGVGSGIANVAVNQTLKGLEKGKTYHYRVTAENEVGSTQGVDKSFTTLPPCKGPEAKCLWSTQSTVDPPANSEVELRGVSCSSATLCVAVGRNLVKQNSFVDMWNGTEWKVIANVSGEMKRISCVSTACMAVGVSSGGAAQTWLVFELSGGWGVSPLAPPLPSGATETVLNGISCASTTCMAVGSYHSESGYKPLVERWNGSAWSLQTAPSPAEGSAIKAMLGVSCSASTFCVAVGEAANKPVAEKWNGTEWSLMTVPKPSGAAAAELASVSCISSTSCMATGDYYETAGNERTLAERWNGTSWSIVASPNPSEAKGFVNFTGVSCSSSTDCKATGYYAPSVSGGVPLEFKSLAESWNGTEWTIQSTPNVAGAQYNLLTDVSCSSSTACTSVGKDSVGISQPPASLAERWNGTSWSIQSVATPTGSNEYELKSVSCISSTSCVAVGKNLYAQNSFAERWTGTEWKVIASVSGEIKRISCASTGCVAVGVSKSGAAQTWLIFEVSGAWGISAIATPLPSGATETVLNGISCSSGTACTAVGSYHSASGYKPLVERWNGTAWSLQTAPSPAEGSAVNAMLSVSCISSTSCVAVGEAANKPVAEKWNGTEWSLTSPPNPSGAKGAKLAGVSCGSTTSCMATGAYYETAGNEKTLAERWNGTSWSIVTSPNPSEAKGFVNFTDVACLSPNACFAAGYYASSVSGGIATEIKTLAESWDGTGWTIQSSPNPSGSKYSLPSGIACTSSIACTFVGVTSSGPLGEPKLQLAERYG